MPSSLRRVAFPHREMSGGVLLKSPSNNHSVQTTTSVSLQLTAPSARVTLSVSLRLTAPSAREPNALLAEEGGIFHREMTGGVLFEMTGGVLFEITGEVFF